MSKKLHPDFLRCESIKVPMYPFEIIFCVLSKQGATWLEKEYHSQARTSSKGNDGKVHIYLKPNAAKDVVAHEIFHVVEILMRAIGQPYGEVPNETWAYLIGWITKEYYKFISGKK